MLGGSIVEEMEKDIFEHPCKGCILKEPLFGIGSGDLLGALFDHFMGKTFGEFLNAFLYDAKALGFPGFVFDTGLEEFKFFCYRTNYLYWFIMARMILYFYHLFQ